MSAAPSVVHIGSRIRQERERQGISQQALADKAGLSRQGICNIEGGKANMQIETLQALAKALDVSEGWLLGRSA